MRRRSAKLLIIGGVLVIAGLVVLQQVVFEGTASTEVPHGSASSTQGIGKSSPGAVPTSRGPARSASLPEIRRPPVPPPDPQGASPALPPTPEEAPAPGTPANPANPQFGKPALREQIAAVEPLLVECAKRAVAAGHRATGSATLEFIVANRAKAIVVETTSIDHDATTIDNPQLLECMRDTANAMKFEGLPRDARAISAGRRVTLEDGVLVDNRLTDFSYLR